MLKAIIIDDERASVENLAMLLQPFKSDLTVVGTAQNALEGIKLIQQIQPDIVFLDVSMPGGTGFDMLEAIGEHRGFSLVFITAHSKFTLPAIRAGAFDYLLKPFDPDELESCIRRIVETRQTPKSSGSRLPLETGAGTYFIPPALILKCEADGNYTKVHCSDNRTILVSKTLLYIEQELPPDLFIRVHQSFLVNIGAIQAYMRDNGGYLLLSDGSQVPIARGRKAEVLRRLKGR